METLDLSAQALPKIEDREFDQRFIGDAMNYLKEIRDNSVDYVTPPKNITIKQTDDQNWSLWIETQDGLKVFAPTAWAKQQTIGVTKLPKKYHDILVDGNHINEAVAHLNMWLAEGNDRRIRTVGPQYRAIVSPGYNSLDNYDAFRTIAGTVHAANLMRPQDQKPVTFYKAQISDQNMYVHLIDEGRPYDLGHGDTYKPMLVFKNSEVGDGAMVVEAGLWRSMCVNLILHGIVSRRIHKGEKLGEGTWAPDTLETQNELWNKIIRDSLNMGIASDQLFDQMISEITQSKETKVDNPTVTLTEIKKAVKLSDSEEQAIIAAMMGDTTVVQEEKNTLFQITQGMTQAAKTFGIERGNEISRIAGDVPMLLKVIA